VPQTKIIMLHAFITKSGKRQSAKIWTTEGLTLATVKNGLTRDSAIDNFNTAATVSQTAENWVLIQKNAADFRYVLNDANGKRIAATSRYYNQADAESTKTMIVDNITATVLS
jgi:uncharacterized protein YegP (UPF0339 family)